MTAPNASGTATWIPTGYGIIADALLNCGAIDEDDIGNIPGPMYQSTLFKLQSMTKAWITTGIHVWTEQEAILFLQPAPFTRYLLGGTTTAMCCDAYSYTYSSLSVNAGPGAATINVQAPVQNGLNYEVGNNVGVVLDSGATFWTTATSVSGLQIGLAAPLPSNASNGENVFTFPPSAQIIRPLKVPNCRYVTWAQNNPGAPVIENPMSVLSRQEYMDQPQKQTPGVPNQWFYNPGRDQGEFFPWNPPVGSNYACRFTWYRPIYDWTSPLSTQDFPTEWAAALTWNLTREIEPSYGVPPATSAKIEKLALQYLEAALSWDREPEPVQWGMDWQFNQEG